MDDGYDFVIATFRCKGDCLGVFTIGPDSDSGVGAVFHQQSSHSGIALQHCDVQRKPLPVTRPIPVYDLRPSAEQILDNIDFTFLDGIVQPGSGHTVHTSPTDNVSSSNGFISEIMQTPAANWSIVLLGMMLVVMSTVSFYMITAYTPTFGSSVLHLASKDNLIVTLCVGISNFVWLPIMGALERSRA